MVNNGTEREQLDARLRSMMARMAQYILATCDFERSDRLCPAHFEVFATNPLSVSYGAAGIAVFLNRVLGRLPDEVRDWMLKQPVSVDEYPPGLYVGLAGIAHAFLELGLHEKAEELMQLTYDSPLLFAEPGMHFGAAGWGSASLAFWEYSRKQLYVDRAVEAGEHLAASALHEGVTSYWLFNQEKRPHYGYGYGSCGIALFLLNLGRDTGRPDFVTLAERGFGYEWAHRSETANGVSWKRFADDLATYPYFVHGAAGVGAAAARFAKLGNAETYLPIAEEIADSTNMRWTVDISSLHGLTGLAEFALDMHQLTGNPDYHLRAREMANTILWYAIPTEMGTAFPGRQQLKITNDWATGAAGIGMFFHRLVYGGPRFLVDIGTRNPSARTADQSQPLATVPTLQMAPVAAPV